METNKVNDNKEYDLSAIEEFFNRTITPSELREELIELAFDYVQIADDGNVENVKDKMSIIYILCDVLKRTQELEQKE